MTDRIVLWINNNIFSFTLANSLQKKHDCQLFGLVDVTDKSKKFFQNQNLVKFEKTWFYHDHIKKQKKNIDLEYLTAFEEKYKINLWQLAINERLFNNSYNDYHKFTYHEILSILEDECKLFENILEESKPDFFITVPTALHHEHLFYELCNARKIKILMLNQFNLGYRCLISQKYNKIDFIDKLSNIKNQNRDFEKLQNYLRQFNPTKQLITYKDNFLGAKKKRLNAAFQFLISENSNLKTHYGYYGRNKNKVLIKEIFFILQTKYRQSFINRNFKREVDAGNFVYFTLHQEPERVLLLGSPYYTNQLETIRHIAKSIPIGFKLYVKDHPTQSIRGWRKISFYKEIMKIPNVELIHPAVNSTEILQKCSLAITVGGSLGLEAAFYQKPSIIMQDLGYAILPSVTRIKSIEDLPEAIHLSLQQKVNLVDLDKYITLIDENAFEFDYYGFIIDYHNHFYYNGNLVNVEISLEKMISFILKHENSFDLVSDEFIKKIKQFKKIF